MRFPEKTVIGASAVLMTFSSLLVVTRVVDGRIAAGMHSMAAAGAGQGFVYGYILGFSLVLGIKLLATLGLWVLLAKRWRAGKAPA